MQKPNVILTVTRVNGNPHLKIYSHSLRVRNIHIPEAAGFFQRPSTSTTQMTLDTVREKNKKIISFYGCSKCPDEETLSQVKAMWSGQKPA